MTLFDLPPLPEPMSAGQRITQRNRDCLARGIHPATGQPLAGNGETCGTCTHHRPGEYHKCVISRLGESRSQASDIRVSWPACKKWEQAG